MGAVFLFIIVLALLLAMYLRNKHQSIILQKEHERVRLMLDTIPLCCFILTQIDKIIDCNSEAVRLFELWNKQEFIERFSALSPKYQPDGRLSSEASYSNAEKAYKEGRCVFNWVYQMLDGTPIPATVTLDRVMYGNDVAIVAYIQDMREHTQMTQKIDYQNDLLQAANRVSSALLEPEMICFEDSLWKSMGILARAVDVDRICVWRNFDRNNGLFCTLTHEWEGGNFKIQKGEDLLAPHIWYDENPGWKENLFHGKCLNSPVYEMYPVEQAQLNQRNIVSIFASPVLMQDSFWGFVGFEDCRRERVFTENEAIILRSASRMIANAIMRNDMTQNIIDSTVMLKAAMDEANEANRVKSRSLSTLERILDSINALIYVSIPDTGEMLFINKQMKTVFGLDNDKGIGQHCFELFYGKQSVCDFCPCHRLEEEPDKIIVWDEYSEMLDRHIRHADCYIDWPDGSKVHLQHAVDITELITAREQAEQSSRSKSIFLSHMSHEIRTPMNAILGIAEIQLQNKKLSPDTQEAFGKIYESGDLLLNIINDILDLSKIESGKLELIPSKYDIPSLINDTAQLNCLRYESKPILFTLKVDQNLPQYLYGDELRIKQILNNILSNAFKYTDEGNIDFSVSVESGPENEAHNGNVTLVFKISDTGQGMTENQLSRLFDEYSRFNLIRNRTTVGAGLGMSIAKRLVDLMNGKIFVESEPGKGTIFIVRLPQARAGSGVCGAELVEKLQNFRFKSTTIANKIQFFREYMPYGNVLIVDDVDSNIYVAKGMLLPYGLKIETASSGLEAIDKIKNGRLYDIVFMDHMMPIMDGIEATKIIRGMGYTNTIVALTANAIVGRAEMFLENGFDSFISKPIDSREMNLVLNEFIRNRKPPEVVEAARREMDTSNTYDDVTAQSLQKIIALDAKNAIKVLENLNEKIRDLNDADISLYITTVHGMKSALANIKENELSDFALKLEKAGNERNFDIMSNETSAFINALQSLVKKLTLCEDGDNMEITDEDMVFLREKLIEIKAACAVFDKRAVKTAMNDLKQKTWSSRINPVLDDITLHILHSAFKKAADAAENCLQENAKKTQ